MDQHSHLKAEPHSVVEMLRTPGIYERHEWILEDRAGPRVFQGSLLGAGSSQRDIHSHGTTPVDGHPGQALFDSYQGRTRCTACRWSEIYIFRVHTSLEHGPFSAFKYCVYTIGASIIAGENTRANVRWATSGFEVIELATVRRGDRGAPFLPAAHGRALAMAADVDEDIAEAYVNRAVA